MRAASRWRPGTAHNRALCVRRLCPQNTFISSRIGQSSVGTMNHWPNNLRLRAIVTAGAARATRSPLACDAGACQKRGGVTFGWRFILDRLVRLLPRSSTIFPSNDSSRFPRNLLAREYLIRQRRRPINRIGSNKKFTSAVLFHRNRLIALSASARIVSPDPGFRRRLPHAFQPNAAARRVAPPARQPA